MATRPRVLSVCAGGGGLDLATSLACESRTVGYVEREASSAARLMARMGKEALDSAPVWDDLRTFEGQRLRGSVDGIIGGIPCQPYSDAGKKAKDQDDRDLVDAFADLVRSVSPAWFFLEEVPPFACDEGLGRLLGQVAPLGFDAEWDVFSAARVGAPHRRRRLYVFAWRVPGGSGAKLGDTNSGGREGERIAQHDREQCERRAVLDGHGSDGGQLWPPGPGSPRWKGVEASSQPAVRGALDGYASRLDERCALRELGNGVVPLAAAYAFRTIAARAGVLK